MGIYLGKRDKRERDRIKTEKDMKLERLNIENGGEV